MKILVLAANGRTGKLVVEQAKNLGHNVISFIYGTSNLPSELEGTTIIRGDATNAEDIAQAIKNIDVVISTIGHTKNSAPNVQALTMQHLLAAAETYDFKIVSLTGTGVRVPGDKITIIDRILNFAVSKIDEPRVLDGIKHVELLQQSDHPWSVVRVLKLTNSRATNSTLSLHGPAKTFVSREEVARALIEVATTNLWDKKMPIIS